MHSGLRGQISIRTLWSTEIINFRTSHKKSFGPVARRNEIRLSVPTTRGGGST